MGLDWNAVSIGTEEQTLFGFGWFFAEERSLIGVQLGLFSSGTEVDSSGLQFGLGRVQNTSSFRGLSMGGFYNETGGVWGVQVAPFGWNHEVIGVQGAQVAFIGNYSAGAVSLAQLGSVSIQHGESSGIQLGLISLTENLTGVQANFLGSLSSKRIVGAQVGSFGWAEEVTGFQVGGFNNARSLTGFQFGIVNIADTVYGTQIGLINIVREMHGVPIGVLDFVGNGENRFVYSSEFPLRPDLSEQLHSFGYRFGSSSFYKELAVSVRSGLGGWYNQYGAGIKIGGRASLVESIAAVTGDLGIGLGNRGETIEVLPGRTFAEHLEFQTRESLEFRIADLFGLQVGLSQRYLVDPWVTTAPQNSMHFIRAESWNLYVVNSLLIGLQY